MKKLIPLAVASAVLGINTAQAVHVNPDGLGQVLLFPYYTVEGGQDTYINLVNTTDQVKAVKVRFRESMNSQEVLDFNLYLSPFDHWSASLSSDGSGAVIRTLDTSCTVPNQLSDGDTIAFKDTIYKAQDEAPWDGIDRTQEGYVEVLEMGVVTDLNLATAATHIAGVPEDCAELQAAFQTGIWNSTGTLNNGISAPTGGLYGYGVLIDVSEGTDATYDATALANWSDTPNHAFPGDSEPDLNDGLAFADIIDDNAIVPMDFDGLDGPINAVSAVLMKSKILNDYILEPSIGAGTDWVVTFPTKERYVNQVVPVAPFTSVWDGTTDRGQACEQVDLGYWDREEDFIRPTPDDLEFSPRDPAVIEVFEICHEANVMTFNGSNVLKPSVRTSLDLSVNFDNGWAVMDLDPVDSLGAPLFDRGLVDLNGTEARGLPVIGFAVQKYVNGELVVDGTTVLSSYAGSVSHKTVVDVQPAP